MSLGFGLWGRSTQISTWSLTPFEFEIFLLFKKYFHEFIFFCPCQCQLQNNMINKQITVLFAFTHYMTKKEQEEEKSFISCLSLR